MPLPCNSKHVSTPPVLAVNANTNDSTNNQNTEGISKRICEPKSRFADDLLKIFKNGGEVKNKIMNVMDKVIETGRFDRAALLEKVSRDDPNLSSYLNAAMAMHELMNSGWLESADKTKDKMTFLMEHLNKNSGMTHSKEKSINPSKSRLREHKIPRDFNAERKDRQRRDPYGLSEKMASKYCNDAPVKSDSFGYGINSNSDLEKSSGKPKIGERSANIYNKLSSGAVGAGGVTEIIRNNIKILNDVKTKIDQNKNLNTERKSDLKAQLDIYLNLTKTADFKKYMNDGGVLVHGDADASKVPCIMMLLLSGRMDVAKDAKFDPAGEIANLLINNNSAWLGVGNRTGAKAIESLLTAANAAALELFDHAQFSISSKHNLCFLGDMSRDRLSGQVRTNEEREPITTDHGFIEFLKKLDITIIAGNHDLSPTLAKGGGAQVGVSHMSQIYEEDNDKLISDIKPLLQFSQVIQGKDGTPCYLSHTGAVIDDGKVYTGAIFYNDSSDLQAQFSNDFKQKFGLQKLYKNIDIDTTYSEAMINIPIECVEFHAKTNSISNIKALHEMNEFIIKQSGVGIGTNDTRLSLNKLSFSADNANAFTTLFGCTQVHGHDDGLGAEETPNTESLNRLLLPNGGQKFGIKVIPDNLQVNKLGEIQSIDIESEEQIHSDAQLPLRPLRHLRKLRENEKDAQPKLDPDLRAPYDGKKHQL